MKFSCTNTFGLRDGVKRKCRILGGEQESDRDAKEKHKAVQMVGKLLLVCAVCD